MRTIDADALLKAIANSGLIWETTECLDVIEVLTVKKIIDNAPTIEPTTVYEFKGCDNCELDRPKGKWITHSDYPDRLICSNCNHRYDVWFIDNGSNFCPNCGADMRGEAGLTEPIVMTLMNI